MENKAIRDLHGKIVERRNKVAAYLDKKGEDGRYNLTKEEAENLKTLNDELADLGTKYDRERELDKAERDNKAALKSLGDPFDPVPFGGMPRGGDGVGQDQRGRVLTLGDLVIESEACKSRSSGKTPFRIEISEQQAFDYIKTLMTETGTSGAGYAPPNNRTPIVVYSPQRRPVVADLIPSTPTSDSAIRYMEETTFTNSAAGVLEGNSKPESANGFTERTVTVETIATTLPITEQQLADVPQLRGIVDNRLTLMMLQSEESSLLTGNGTSPQLAGFLTKAGVQSYALGTDVTGEPVPDAIMRAMTLVRFTGFAEPSAAIFHPNDWRDIRLLRTTTGDYIWGSPSEVGPERIWGLRTVVTPVMTQNTCLLGDFLLYSMITRRQGLTIEVGYVNDDFKKNQKTIRAEERLALLILRASAFCKVTGI